MIDEYRRFQQSAVRHFAVLAGLCLAVSTARSDDRPPDAAVAVRLDGSRLSGRLLSASGNRVRIERPGEEGTPVDLDSEQLLSLELPVARSNRSQTSALPVLEFANGDRVAAEIRRTNDDQLEVSIENAALAVPLEVLRGVAFHPLDPDDGSAALMFRQGGADDLVLLTNGDRLAGRLVAIGDADLVLEAAERELRVPRPRIAAISFSPELIDVTRLEGPRQIVTAASGSMTVTDLVGRDDGSWQAQTLFGQPIAWPADSVRRVQFAGGRVAFLSDLEPSRIEFTPYLHRDWPVRFDRTVVGEPLAAEGTAYAKGLGVHSRCRVTYDLAGEYVAFSAVAALAQSAGDIGCVEFAVELDGREVVRTGPVSLRDPPVPIDNLNLRGVDQLVLTVDYGRNGDVRDRANWLDAVLVRE